MFKFIHAADIHLDSPQKGLDRYEGAPVEECRRATRRALENLVRLAIDERVAFVLIVGDLYDGDWPDYNTGLYLGAQLARLRDAQVPVFLIRGNHDAANQMTRALRLPDNVSDLRTDRPETRHLDDCNVAIHGQGFATRAVTNDLAATYPTHEPGRFNIGLLHTCANGREGHEPYAPCTVEDLRFKGYDYWALGHIHQREVLHVEPLIVFPGNLQGRHIRESGPKGCLLVTVDDAHHASIELRCLDVVRWESCRVDASGAIDGDDILDRFKSRLDDLVPACDSKLLALRVEIHGRCPAHEKVIADWSRWTEQIRMVAIDAGDGKVWVEKVQPRTSPPSAPDPMWLADGPLAELTTLLDELRGDERRLAEFSGKELIELKKKLPADLAADLAAPDRLRGLLDQLGAMLVNRLLTREGSA